MNFDKSINIEVYGELVEGTNDIAQSWSMILNTVPGSDPLRPAFGSGAYNWIDKPVNQFEGDFASMVIRDLERWEKRATIKQVQRVINKNGVDVIISGVYTESNTPILVTIGLSDLASQDLTGLQKAYNDAYNAEAYN